MSKIDNLYKQNITVILDALERITILYLMNNKRKHMFSLHKLIALSLASTSGVSKHNSKEASTLVLLQFSMTC